MPDFYLNYLWGGLSIGYWTEMCPGEVPWGEWSAKPLDEQLGQIATNILSKITQAMQVELMSSDSQDLLTEFLTRYWEAIRADRDGKEVDDEDYLFD